MKRYLRWTMALLTLMAMTLGAAAEGLEALYVEVDGAAQGATSPEVMAETPVEGVDPLAGETELTLGDEEDDAQGAAASAEDGPALELEPEAVEAPDGVTEPNVAQADDVAEPSADVPEPDEEQPGETPEDEPDAAQLGEAPEDKPDAAQDGEKSEDKPGAAQDGETSEDKPEAAQVGETSQAVSEESGAAAVGEAGASAPAEAQAGGAQDAAVEIQAQETSAKQVAEAAAAAPATIVLGVRERYAIPGMEGAVFSSANKRIATVNAAGVVRGKKKGRTRVVAVRGAETVEYTVRVKKAPKKIKFSKKKLTLSFDPGRNFGEQRVLKPKLSKGSSSRITYYGYDPKVVSVSAEGVLTAVGVGTTKVTARTYNKKKARITVRVKLAPGASATEVPVPIAASLAMGKGERSLPLLGGANVNTVCGGVKFTSTNRKVATVSTLGVVRARKIGKATIRIKGANGSRVNVKIRVYKAPGKVTLNAKKLTMDEYTSVRLIARVPKGQAGAVAFKSSNAAVAQVDATGLVTAVGAGKAVITAFTYNGKKAKCTVKVSPITLEIRMADVARCATGRSTVFPIEVVTSAGAPFTGPVSVTIDPADVAVYDNGRLWGLRGGQTAQLTVNASGTTRSCAVIVEDSNNARPVLAIAHRGSVHWPENTLEAFRYFATTGADAVELDVRSTSDGVQAVLHDATYYSNGVQHSVVNETYETVKALFPSVCTLDEALDEISKSERDIFLNLKDTADSAKCVQAVRAHGLQSRTVYFCGLDQLLAKVYETDASAKLGFSLGSGAISTGQEVDDRVKALHVSYIMLHKNLVSQTLIDYWHQRDCKVCAWTVNDKDTMRVMCDMGVDGILTDYPEYCVEVRARG